jgi:hypothetical protein
MGKASPRLRVRNFQRPAGPIAMDPLKVASWAELALSIYE